MSNEMGRKEYVSLLEQAIGSGNIIDPATSKIKTDFGTVEKIRQWDGKGKLQTTLDDADLDDIIDKVSSGKKKRVIGEGQVTKNSPLSILEGEEDNEAVPPLKEKGEVDLEETGLTEQESEILKRLISEMDELTEDVKVNIDVDDDDEDEEEEDNLYGKSDVEDDD